jgi:putative redox protein
MSSSNVTVELQGGMHFSAHGVEPVCVDMDSSPEHGGRGEGLRPMELMLASLGGCTAMDVISILRKRRQDVTSYRVEVSGTQTEERPNVFREIQLRHIFRGNQISEDAVRQSIELSETKYCPAYAMLSKAATITSTYAIEATSPTD